MSILASFTRVPERAGSVAMIPGTAKKPVATIAAQRDRRRVRRGFMELRSILGS
jgi:hypothetical protein